MSKDTKEKRELKKVYVTEETLAKLFSYKYNNRHKNMEEVIANLLSRADEKQSE